MLMRPTRSAGKTSYRAMTGDQGDDRRIAVA